MAYGLPGNAAAGGRQDLVGVLEGVGAFEAVLVGDVYVVQVYVRLPDGALAHLARYELGGVAGVVLAVLVFFEDEGLDLAVFDVAGPDDDEVGEGGVADPTLLAVQDPSVPVAPGCCFQHHGVGAVIRLRQAPGPYLLHPRHLGQPPPLLLLGPEDGHGPHREPGMDAEERVKAPVPPRHLDGDEPGSDLAHAGTAVLLDGGARYVQSRNLGHELERELGLLPVLVYDRDDLGVGEGPDPVPDLSLLIGEQLVEQVVVGPQRPGYVSDHCFLLVWASPNPNSIGPQTFTQTYYPCYYQN